MGGVEQAPRRRRTPEEAEREILDAAGAFLRERPFRDLTVDEVMAATGLSRPSFYVYFRDRHALVMRLVESIAGELFGSAESWLEGPGQDPVAESRRALELIAGVYLEHGEVLRAIADAATQDADVERSYAVLIDGFVDAVTRQIELEVERGNAEVDDPRRTATALVWMHERMYTMSLARDPADDPAAVVDALHSALVRTVYGRV